jgi:phosphoribosylaminoimidazolecarboxamide formyltransferase/IMP cyclohydrolase
VEAWRAALECDPVSAFGGIVAVNRPLDGATANAICQNFTEVVIAPAADEAARAAFAGKPNLRLLLVPSLPDPRRTGQTITAIAGGLLQQDRDNGAVSAADLRVLTQRQPTAAELADCLFAWTVARHVKSNAIVFAREGATAGIGAGQMNRRDSARIAAMRAAEAAEVAGWPEPRTRGSAMASDAFLPFADGVEMAVAAGASCIIQPGGAMRDAEVIAAADAAGLAMVFTGMRHFRH